MREYGFYVNGKLKYGWSGDGITSYSQVTEASSADPISGAPLTGANAWLDPGTGQLATRRAHVGVASGTSKPDSPPFSRPEVIISGLPRAVTGVS